MTGTNEPIAIRLSAASYDYCVDDTNFYSYILMGGSLTNGFLSGTPPNLIYTPTNGAGIDSFQFNASDGVWTSSFPATVTIYVVNGPILTTTCYPFGTAVQPVLNVDDVVYAMWQYKGLNIDDFIVYRSTNSGGPYTPISTNAFSQMVYADTNVVVGQTNYYVGTFESHDDSTGLTYESPFSNEIEAAGRPPDDLLPPDAIWDVTDITDTNNPIHLGNLPAPFSTEYPNQYPGLYPWPSTNWPTGTMRTNHVTVFVPTNVVDLSQVNYSIAIDNDCWLYLNDSTNFIDAEYHEGYAVWSPFRAFEDVAPGLLHYGTNDIGVVIRDNENINYFSMVIVTNTCGR